MSPLATTTSRKSFDDLIYVAIWFMRIAGILPLFEARSLWKRSINDIVIISLFISSLCILIPLTVFVLTCSSDVDEILDALSVLIFGIGTVVKLLVMLSNREEIRRLLEFCRATWYEAEGDDLKIVLTWAQRIRLITITYCSMGQVTSCLFNWTPIIEQSLSTSNSTTRSFPYPTVFKVTRSPQYELYYFFQFFCGHVCTAVLSGCDVTVTILTLTICGQLQILQAWLSTIEIERKGSDFNENTRIILRKFIRRHKIVSRFCVELERTVCNVNLIQIVYGMYMIALSATRLMSGMGMYRHVGTLVVSVSGLYFSCWSADVLNTENTKLAEALCAVPWYRFSSSMRKVLIMTLMKSQHPIQLTASKFATVSIATFSTVMSNGLSLCILLRSF